MSFISTSTFLRNKFKCLSSLDISNNAILNNNILQYNMLKKNDWFIDKKILKLLFA